jgi:hypothetical protein
MAKFCPINNKQTDEHVVRLNALLVVSLLLLVVIAPLLRWLIALVAADFAIRGFRNPSYSPLVQINKPLVEALGWQPRLINLAPKQFAARIGFVLSTLAAISFLAGWSAAGFGFASIVLFFAFLEGAFGFCVACLLYPFVVRLQGE